MRIMPATVNAIAVIAGGIGGSLLATVIWSYMTAESTREIHETNMSLNATVKHLDNINATTNTELSNLKQQIEKYKMEGYLDIENSAAYFRDKVSKIEPIALAYSTIGHYYAPYGQCD